MLATRPLRLRQLPIHLEEHNATYRLVIPLEGRFGVFGVFAGPGNTNELPGAPDQYFRPMP